MLDVSLGGALLAGLLSFVSPCVLPIVPPYLAWLAGVSFEDLKTEAPGAAQRRHVTLSAFAFVLGFTTVFVALGATASVLGRTIAQYFDILSVIAGVVIIVMGLHFLGVFRIALLYREARVQVDRKPAGFLGAYVMGLAFAFGWTPCIGPVLAAILAVAGSEQSVAEGALLLAAYSAGLGIPFLLAALAMKPFVALLKRMRSRFSLAEKTMGGLLVLTGIAFLTGWITNMSFWLLETFPALATLG
jgi:cytochrome c-type biogenesis protein